MKRLILFISVLCCISCGPALFTTVGSFSFGDPCLCCGKEGSSCCSGTCCEASAGPCNCKYFSTQYLMPSFVFASPVLERYAVIPSNHQYRFAFANEIFHPPKTIEITA